MRSCCLERSSHSLPVGFKNAALVVNDLVLSLVLDGFIKSRVVILINCFFSLPHYGAFVGDRCRSACRSHVVDSKCGLNCACILKPISCLEIIVSIRQHDAMLGMHPIDHNVHVCVFFIVVRNHQNLMLIAIL